MKYKAFLSLLIFIININIHSIDNNSLQDRSYRYFYPGFDKNIFFSSTYFRYTEESIGRDEELIEKKIDGKYKLNDFSGITYIEFGEAYKKKWLILFNSHIITLYESDGEPFFLGFLSLSTENEIIYNEWPDSLLAFLNKLNIQSNSQLTEIIGKSEKKYSAKNIKNIALPFPWVEGEKDYGKGVKIFMNGITVSEKVNSLFFSNGYVSYKRPDLYRKNSRVKKIRIYDKASGNHKDFDIPDSPHYFEIDLKPFVTGEEIIIEILDVYPGTEYKDTCINQILYYSE